ncbi:hypothetical protein ANCDUO_23946 [Ancylostoma duodenale]|uniref:Uncharacterized protein n=1 Tax=Ancylostoma duodenale TaxID=51022 RepID=A0A0C2BQE0_9BILA|nr:hypothetical protein ANCDUO_23946 [Ancylostoma duodenale]
MANRVVSTLPRIQATIGHIPQRLKTAGIEPSSRARLEVLRRIVTRMVREERAELQWNRAVEARPYLERVLVPAERPPENQPSRFRVSRSAGFGEPPSRSLEFACRSAGNHVPLGR